MKLIEMRKIVDKSNLKNHKFGGYLYDWTEKDKDFVALAANTYDALLDIAETSIQFLELGNFCNAGCDEENLVNNDFCEWCRVAIALQTALKKLDKL